MGLQRQSLGWLTRWFKLVVWDGFATRDREPHCPPITNLSHILGITNLETCQTCVALQVFCGVAAENDFHPTSLLPSEDHDQCGNEVLCAQPTSWANLQLWQSSLLLAPTELLLPSPMEPHLHRNPGGTSPPVLASNQAAAYTPAQWRFTTSSLVPAGVGASPPACLRSSAVEFHLQPRARTFQPIGDFHQFQAAGLTSPAPPGLTSRSSFTHRKNDNPHTTQVRKRLKSGKKL